MVLYHLLAVTNAYYRLLARLPETDQRWRKGLRRRSAKRSYGGLAKVMKNTSVAVAAIMAGISPNPFRVWRPPKPQRRRPVKPSQSESNHNEFDLPVTLA